MTANPTTPAVDPSVSFGADGDCPICLCKFVDPVRLPCGHHLCAGCLKELRKYRHLQVSTCPTCRGVFPPSPQALFDSVGWKYVDVLRAWKYGQQIEGLEGLLARAVNLGLGDREQCSLLPQLA